MFSSHSRLAEREGEWLRRLVAPRSSAPVKIVFDASPFLFKKDEEDFNRIIKVHGADGACILAKLFPLKITYPHLVFDHFYTEEDHCQYFKNRFGIDPLAEDAGFDPNEKRVPSGQPEGGEWAGTKAHLDLNAPDTSAPPHPGKALYHQDKEGNEHIQVIGHRHKQDAAPLPKKSLFSVLEDKALPLFEREEKFRKDLNDRIDQFNNDIYDALPPKVSVFLKTLEPVLGKPTEYPLWLPGANSVKFFKTLFKQKEVLKAGKEFATEAFKTLTDTLVPRFKGEEAALAGLSKQMLEEDSEPLLKEVHGFYFRPYKPLTKRSQFDTRSHPKGHGEERHGNKENEAKRRKLNPDLRDSSYFLNTKMMNKLASKIVFENQARLRKELVTEQLKKGSKKIKIAIDVPFNRVIGYMTKKDGKLLSEPVPLTKMRVVVRQDNSKPGGIGNWTEFPVE